MQQKARYVLAAAAWIFLAGVVTQVFLAGLGLFGAGPMQLHVDVGWALHLAPLLIVLLVWLARPGRRVLWPSLALVATVFVQPILVITGVPLIAALHPVNALAIFWLGLLVARRSLMVARSRPAGVVEPSIRRRDA